MGARKMATMRASMPITRTVVLSLERTVFAILPAKFSIFMGINMLMMAPIPVRKMLSVGPQKMRVNKLASTNRMQKKISKRCLFA